MPLAAFRSDKKEQRKNEAEKKKRRINSERPEGGWVSGEPCTQLVRYSSIVDGFVTNFREPPALSGRTTARAAIPQTFFFPELVTFFFHAAAFR